MSTYQTKGIILKIADRGEADQLFGIYTAKMGKISALGKGTKKIKSKLNSHLRQFAVINLMVATGKNYDHIAAAEIVKYFSWISNDLKKIIYASFALELVEKMTKDGMADMQIYNLLNNYLAAINEHSYTDKQWLVIKRAFITKFLTILGFAPPANISNDSKKLENFFIIHLEKPLEIEKFLVKMHS